MPLPNVNVLDASGAPTAVPTLRSGRASAADSAGVALSTEDLAQIAAVVAGLADVVAALGATLDVTLTGGSATVSGSVTMDGPLPAGGNLIGSVKTVSPDPLTPIGAGGAIVAGGTAQSLFAANSARRGILVTNLSAGDLYVNELGAAALGVGHPIAPGKTLILDGIWAPVSAVSIWGATTAQAFTARAV